MALKLYSTLSRAEEALGKNAGDTVGIYTCGPTVYHYAHIGNLRSFLLSDVLKRTLRYLGYDVKQVINITDVGHLVGDGDEGEDKVEAGARREGRSVKEIADFYTKAFFDDLEALNIDTVDTVFPKASEHIEEQIELVKTLEAKGFTYQTFDGVYFDTKHDPAYGKLSHLSEREIEEGARVEKNPEKRNPTDFALWKFSKEGEKREQEWKSPWGTGFPGWHIECSAMSMKYLGEHFDIHTGGTDLIFPHHENEIAQSECATGKPFADIFMHAGFVNSKGKKLAKSEGALVRLANLVEEGFSPLAYRLLLLGTHYRKPLEWSEEALVGAEQSYKKLIRFARDTEGMPGAPNEALVGEFKEALEDDLNTPLALSVAWKALDTAMTPGDKRATVLEFDRVLGLRLRDATKEEAPEALLSLAREREAARQSADWALADDLRKKIESEGWRISDTDSGPVLEKK